MISKVGKDILKSTLLLAFYGLDNHKNIENDADTHETETPLL